MERDSASEPRVARWTKRLEQWLGRAAAVEREQAQAAVVTPEAEASVQAHDGGAPRRSVRAERRGCARCGRSLRWALPLCWDCEVDRKRAGR